MSPEPTACEYVATSGKVCGRTPIVARWEDSVSGDWFVVCDKHDQNAIKKAPPSWKRKPLTTEVNA